MIVRVWQGVAPQNKARDHINYIRQQLLHAYLKAPGNRGALLLSRRRVDHTEFLLLSFWESAFSVEALTGLDVEGALPEELVNPFPMVKNFEVVMYHLPDEG